MKLKSIFSHIRSRRDEAFSLVEVTISIGIVTFCLLALVGLLPVGLNSVKTAREEAAAASALEMIAGSIRQATSSNGTNYSALGAYSNLTWTYGGGAKVNFNPDVLPLSLSGAPTQNANEERLVAYVDLEPPSATNTGNALLTVAWPKTAKWNSSANSWSNAQGSVTTWLVFLSR